MTVRAVVAPLLVACVTACGIAGPPDTLPPQLLGIWRTDAPGYRDRSFELRPGWVLFGTGGHSVAMYPVDDVHVTRAGNVTHVVVAYRTEDDALLEVALEWTPGNPDRLRIGRRHDVWVPEARAHWLSEDDS